MEIVYLGHSGFVVETDSYSLIFDYYQDRAQCLPRILESGKKIIFFSSHSHSDHFNPAIAKWEDKVLAYVLSVDIQEAGGLPGILKEKLIYVSAYEKACCEDVKITTYGSTDLGVSFLVEAENKRIFHAGDLNWWHWKGDTKENIHLAEEEFKQELSRLCDEKLDVAFFPVDSRLEEYRAIGARAFCQATDTRQLVAMHNCGEIWCVEDGFPGGERKVPVWCPAQPGDCLNI